MKSFYVIANPYANSENSQNDWDLIREYLTQHDVHFQSSLTNAVGDAKKCIQNFIENLDNTNYDEYVVLVVGGNDTLNEVLNGIKEKDICNLPLAFICTGKHHQFADQLGISRSPVVALRQILNTTDPIEYSLIQYYESNHEKTGYFINDYSIGMTANLANIHEMRSNSWISKHFHWMTWIIDICKTYYNNADGFKITLRIDNKYQFYKRAFIVNIQNLTQEKNFSYSHSPIKITIVDRVNIFIFLILVVLYKFNFDFDKLPFIHHYQSDKLHISINALEQTRIDCQNLGGKYNDLYLKLVNYPFWINADSVSVEERHKS